MPKLAVNERIPFRVFVMPCCMHMLCWVNSRFPSYCPGCGADVRRNIRESVTLHDLYTAHLRYSPNGA
jgi:hypothetical protein